MGWPTLPKIKEKVTYAIHIDRERTIDRRKR